MTEISINEMTLDQQKLFADLQTIARAVALLYGSVSKSHDRLSVLRGMTGKLDQLAKMPTIKPTVYPLEDDLEES